MNSFVWSSLLPFIALISVILTISLGIIGLRQGHNSKGKLTRRGRRAVTGMVALGLVTLLSGIADQQISRAKEERDAASRATQFNRQMASLEIMTGNLADVQRSLQDSIRRQEQVALAANQNLRMGRALQAQYQENTRNILTRLFEETNRINISEVRVPVTLFCESGDSDRLVFPVPTHVSIQINGARGGIDIYSTTIEPEILGATFYNFQNHLGGYDTFPAWRGAQASVRILALTHERRAVEGSGGIQQFEVELSGPDSSYVPGECTGIMTLILNGRTMLMTTASLRETARGRFEGRVENVRVSREALPSFSF